MIATLAFAADATTEGLDLLVDDAKQINSYAMGSLDKMVKSDAELKVLEQKIENFSKEVSKFNETQMQNFSNTEDALASLDKLEELSSQSMVLAKELTYISSHQMDNANDSYKQTLDGMLKTTLRLSDDIGTMSDRILDMADKIGVMADRIVETQKIQSRNLGVTAQLTQMAMQQTSMQMTQTRHTASHSMANMNGSASQSMQNTPQVTQAMPSASSPSMPR